MNVDAMRCFTVSLLLGCSGGQTGEITEPTACERATQTLAIEALPEAVGEGLEHVTHATAGGLVWSDGATTTLSLEPAVVGADVERLGDAPCAPSWRVPLVVQVTTSDARLDAALEGALVVHEDGTAVARAETPLEDSQLVELDALLTTEGASTELSAARLQLSAAHDAAGWRGTFFLRDGEAEHVIATF